MGRWTVPQLEPWISVREKQLVMQCLDNSWITEGPKASRFLDMLQSLIGFIHGDFAPNGTLALFLGLLALDIPVGGEIIIPDITFYASATAAVLAGLVPIFCDVKPGTYQIDPQDAERRITDQTVAIMPVHLFGGACDMTAVMDLADVYGLAVVEDAAQGVGVSYNGQHVGTFGEIGMFSFFADKTITTGEGGLVVCQDRDIFKRILFGRNQGRIERGTFMHESIGWNFRITDVQAAIGIAQLERIDQIADIKRAYLRTYQEQLEDINGLNFLQFEPGTDHVIPFRAVIFAQDAPALMQHLVEHSIQPRTFFQPMHRQAAMSQYHGGQDADYPISVLGAEHGICLPVYPTLRPDQVGYVCSAIRSYYGKD